MLLVGFFPVVDIFLSKPGMNVQLNAGNEFRRERGRKRWKKDGEGWRKMEKKNEGGEGFIYSG
jgi:hypothetical protein